MGQQGGFDNEMRFTLFKNKKKQAGDNKPDLTGKVQIGGVLYWLSAWSKTPNGGGDKFLSGTVRPVEEDGQQGGGQGQKRPAAQGRPPAGGNNRPPQQEGGGEQFKEDDIPF